MKIWNIVLIGIFLLSAALQYNDPDPYVWIPIYLFSAYLCFEAIKGNFKQPHYVIGLIVYCLYAIYLFVDTQGVLSWYNNHEAENLVQSMKATKPWIEETREFGVLLICIIALISNMVYFKTRRKYSG